MPERPRTRQNLRYCARPRPEKSGQTSCTLTEPKIRPMFDSDKLKILRADLVTLQAEEMTLHANGDFGTVQKRRLIDEKRAAIERKKADIESLRNPKLF